MVLHNSTPDCNEDKDEWAEVGETGKPEENDQDMMEEDRKKEKSKNLQWTPMAMEPKGRR
eukprot:8900418-Ditylum_brightwellii.AAC.1